MRYVIPYLIERGSPGACSHARPQVERRRFSRLMIATARSAASALRHGRSELRLRGFTGRRRHPGGRGLRRARAGSWRSCYRRRSRCRIVQRNQFLPSCRPGSQPRTGVSLRPPLRRHCVTGSETRLSCLPRMGRMLGNDRVSARCVLPRRQVFGRHRRRDSGDAHLGRACWPRRRDRRRRGIGRSVAAHHQDRRRLDWIVRAGREKNSDCHYRRRTWPRRSNFPHCTPSFGCRRSCPDSMPNQYRARETAQACRHSEAGYASNRQ